MVTGRQYAEQALKILDIRPKAGYIWGEMNTLWTDAYQAALFRKYNSNPSKYSDLKLGAQIGSKWIGHRVWDCSGLTKYCGMKFGLNYHHGSNSSYLYDCQAKGEKTPNMKLPVGAWVYTGTPKNRGHIGVVVDSEWVVEAQGTNAGVVKSKLSLKKWTWWGLGKGMVFDFIPGGATVDNKPVDTVVVTEPVTGIGTPAVSKPAYPQTVRRGDRGETVKKLQTLLAKNGSSLQIDGIFGPGTESAVRAYQRKHNLTVDGIVGPKTWAELLK